MCTARKLCLRGGGLLCISGVVYGWVHNAMRRTELGGGTYGGAGACMWEGGVTFCFESVDSHAGFISHHNIHRNMVGTVVGAHWDYGEWSTPIRSKEDPGMERCMTHALQRATVTIEPALRVLWRDHSCMLRLVQRRESRTTSVG